MKIHILVLAAVTAMALTACSSVRDSVPIAQGALSSGVMVARQLPVPLPARVSPIPDSLYIMVLPDSVASLAVPIPFVGDAVVDQMHQHDAKQYQQKFAAADPYQMAVTVLQAGNMYRETGASYILHPFVVIQQGYDDLYRVSLVYQLDGDNWMGRYLYHLPTTYAVAEFKNTPPAEIRTLQKELAEGAQVLTDLMLRDSQGKLNNSGKTATVGSLFIVGSRISGLLSPTVLSYPNTAIIEEGADYVIVRGRADIKAEGQAGALMFGVQYFHRDQLHAYKVE